MQKTLKKPTPDFPLTPHKNGYWIKKIRGKTHYIGPRWATPEVALREWRRVRDDLMLNGTAKPDETGLTLKDAMNHFLCDRKQRLELGEIVDRTYQDYVVECKRVVQVLGASTIVTGMTVQHFAKLKKSFTGTSPNTIAGCVTRVRVAFKYLFDAGLIEKPMRFGPSFKKPTAKAMRLHRATKPKKLLKASDARLLVSNASPQMAAMILLGVNVGFGNADCGKLLIENLDLKNGWHDFGRPKTGIERRAWLWPETVNALKRVIGSRTKGPVFVTKYGNLWVKVKCADPISAEFRKLSRKHGVNQTFYALRHTFETIGGSSKDQVAVDAIMGHVPTGMSATYREEIPDDRIKAVCEFVRSWYIK